MSVIEFGGLASALQCTALDKLTKQSFTIVSASGGMPRHNKIENAIKLLQALLSDNLILFTNEYQLPTFYFSLSKHTQYLSNTPIIAAHNTNIYKVLDYEIYDLSALTIHAHKRFLQYDPKGSIIYYGGSLRKDRKEKLFAAYKAGIKIYLSTRKLTEEILFSQQFVPPQKAFAGIYITDSFFNKHKRYTFMPAARLYEHALDDVPLLFLRSDIENIYMPQPPAELVFDSFDDMLKCNRDKVRKAFDSYKSTVLEFAHEQIADLLKKIKPTIITPQGRDHIKIMLDYMLESRIKLKDKSAYMKVLYSSFREKDRMFFVQRLSAMKKIALLF